MMWTEQAVKKARKAELESELLRAHCQTMFDDFAGWLQGQAKDYPKDEWYTHLYHTEARELINLYNEGL